MPANLIFTIDGTVQETAINLGAVPSPGTSVATRLILANVGDTAAGNLSVSVPILFGNDGNQWARLAPDVSGVPGPFTAGPLTLNPLQPGQQVALWTEADIQAGLTPSGNPRRYKVIVNGASGDFRTYQALFLKAHIFRRTVQTLSLKASIFVNDIDQTNLVWWFRADAVGFPYADGAAMTSGWKDHGSGHHDLTIPVAAPDVTPGIFHTTGVNGLPYVSIASGQGFDIPFGNISPAVSSKDLTFYWVADFAIPNGGLAVALNVYEDPTIVLAADIPIGFYGPGDPPAASFTAETSDAGGFNVRHTTAASSGGLQVVTCVINGTAGTITWYQNGIALTNEHAALQALTHTLGNDTVELFHYADAVYFVGKQCENVAYKAAHDATAVASNAAILKTRWGIP